MFTTLQRASVLLLLLAILNSRSTRSVKLSLKLKSRSKFPLKAEEHTVWRDPPALLFRGWKNTAPLPSLLDTDPKKLHKLIKKYEPRYMSIKKPEENLTTDVENVLSRREILARMPSELRNLHFTVPGSERELGARASKKLRFWLWNLSSCQVLALWKDFGPTIWPRYVNVGQCQIKNTCSYPTGMRCKPSKYKRIYTLYWVCSEQIRVMKGRKCIWVPYPTDVIEKCKCSC